MDDETAVPGWDKICKIVGWKLRTAYRRRDELREAGVIFYRTFGRPKRRQVFCFPSKLKAWTGMKAVKGENV